MNTIDKAYQNLLQDILENGIEKRDRTGTGTISVFGRQIRHKMSEGFPLLTTKKMAFKTMVTELLWFLRGETNIKFLLDYDCHIWDGDAYKNWKNKGRDYWEEQVDGIFTSELGEDEVGKISMEWFINKIKTDDEFAKKWGELGPIYGKQWRKWPSIRRIGIENGGMIHKAYPDYGDIDQIQNLINELKTNPDSRRLMVNAWNVGELDQMVLPPCHYGFQVYTRELSEKERMDLYNKSNWNKDIFPSDVSGWNRLLDTYNIPTRAISLMFNMRSTDVGLGLGFNLASYGLLLMMIAKQVNMVPDELIYNGGDVHLYKNHIEPIKEQLNREPYPLPIVKLSDRVVNDIADYTLDDIVLENYKSHPTIKMPLSN
jgi:thymidylate synthase